MFFYILIFIIIIITIFLFATINVRVIDFNFCTAKPKGEQIDNKLKIIITIYVFSKMPILRVKLTKEKLKNLKNKKMFKNFKFPKIQFKEISIVKLKNIKNHLPKVKQISLVANIGIEDAALTSYVAAAFSGMLGIVLKSQIEASKSNFFVITPIYANMDYFAINLNCMAEINMLHIIYLFSFL